MKLEDLQKQLDEVYESPTLKLIKDLEKNRSYILATSSFGEMLESKKVEVEKLISSSSFQDMFKSSTDYINFTSPILNSLQQNSLQDLQNSISISYEPYLKPQVSETLKALAESQLKLSGYANIGNTKIDDYLGSSIKSALESIIVNENLLDSAKKLSSSLGQIDTNMFRDTISKLEEERKLLEVKPYQFHESMNIEIPKNPICDVIEQNEKIISHMDLQNKSLIEIGKYLATQNEKLDQQNNITEQQIKANDKSSKKALWIAIISIVISIVVSMGSIYVSYDVYNKEEISNNVQYEELLKKIDGSNDIIEQNDLLRQLLQEVKTQNKLLVNKNQELSKVQKSKSE